jgi:hypothetical protein
MKTPSEIAAQNTVWKHWRTGNVYTVLHYAILERTGEESVVYRGRDSGVIWVRPAREFFDGRFQPVPSAACGA